MKGMARPITVVAATVAVANESRADLTVNLLDYLLCRGITF
jgi:hypothetical protein